MPCDFPDSHTAYEGEKRRRLLRQYIPISSFIPVLHKLRS